MVKKFALSGAISYLFKTWSQQNFFQYIGMMYIILFYISLWFSSFLLIYTYDVLHSFWYIGMMYFIPFLYIGMMYMYFIPFDISIWCTSFLLIYLYDILQSFWYIRMMYFILLIYRYDVMHSFWYIGIMYFIPFDRSVWCTSILWIYQYKVLYSFWYNGTMNLWLNGDLYCIPTPLNTFLGSPRSQRYAWAELFTKSSGNTGHKHHLGCIGTFSIGGSMAKTCALFSVAHLIWAWYQFCSCSTEFSWLSMQFMIMSIEHLGISETELKMYKKLRTSLKFMPHQCT